MQKLGLFLLGLVPGSVVAGLAGPWLAKKLGFIEKKELNLLAIKIENVKNPVLQEFLKDVCVAIDKAVPDAGSARYAVLADMIVAELPVADRPLARPVLVAVLSSLGANLKSVLDTQEAPKQVQENQ